MKTVAILGVSGSIGRRAVEVVRRNPDLFKLVLVANAKDRAEIEKLKAEFKPKYAFCGDDVAIADPSVYSVADIVVNGISGVAGLMPTVAVGTAGKVLATANKEAVVSAGLLLNRLKTVHNSTIIPVDSEHSAVFQCMCGEKSVPTKLILTASGGAFRDMDKASLAKAKAQDALRHPTWAMGRKVTVDSATLMNKGFEVVEAKRLFGIENVEVIVHRESIVHALVEYTDGTQKAVLSNPDMAGPIQYAMTYPERRPTEVAPLRLQDVGKLTFMPADRAKFPCLAIGEGIRTDAEGAVVASADEVLVKAYLAGKIGFYDIPKTIEKCLTRFADAKVNCVSDVTEIYSDVTEYITKGVKTC